MLATWRIGPALAAGNTVVAKPPEWAPLTASLLADIAHEAGLPPGVFNVVQGTGAGAGAPLTRHPGINRLSFTGSVPTAGVIAAAAAPNIVPLSFELGGKSPLLVFDDADLDLAVDLAVEQFDNAGQVCLGAFRILVQESIADEFLARVVERASALVQGDPRDEATDVSALVSRTALRAGRRLRRAGDRRRRQAGPRRRPEHRPRRPLLPPDDPGRRRAGQRDPHRGGLRSGADRPDLRHRGGGRGDGQRHPVRAGGHPGHRRPRAGRAGQRGAVRRHRVGQLLLRPRPRCARSAAAGSPASAARAGTSPSTSTATSRTPSSARPAGPTATPRGRTADG